jgi:cyclic pyranopterin phosphate synthase
MDNIRENIDYLRISVTDRCNLRCNYCIPKEGIVHHPQEAILTFEEIVRLVKIFVSLGITKVRLTGGEPLVRKDIIDLIYRIKNINGLKDVSLTTNGSYLSLYAEDLQQIGVKKINVSLDTLKEHKFRLITGGDCFYNVLEGIRILQKLNFYPIKLNMVVRKGINDDEIIDFVHFAKENGFILRFIEFMNVTPLWDRHYFIPIEDVKYTCQKVFPLEKINYISGGPAEYYCFKKSIIGFIKTSEENCKHCSRLRLTSTGDLKLCLYQPRGIPLRGLLRKNMNNSQLRERIKKLIFIKGNVNYTHWEKSKVYMCSVGG